MSEQDHFGTAEFIAETREDGEVFFAGTKYIIVAYSQQADIYRRQCDLTEYAGCRQSHRLRHIGGTMNPEIWVAHVETKTVVYAGRQKEIEKGHIEKDAAKFIAAGEGKTLLIVDGHQAMHMVHRDHFTEHP